MSERRAAIAQNVAAPVADVPIEVLLSALHNFERCLKDIAQADVARHAGPGAWRSIGSQMRVSAAMFVSPAARLCVSEDALLSRVLALRALYARGSQVRRCVDRDRLAMLRNAVGIDTFARLMRVAPTVHVAEPDWPAELSLDTLVADGLSRLRHTGGIDEPSLVHLLSLRFGAAMPPSPLNAINASDTLRESARFFSDLPSLLPEFV